MLKQEISRLITMDVKDPAVRMVSITRIKLTDDLKFATVYTSILGDEKAQKTTMQGLDRAKSFIRAEIARKTDLRVAPDLKFVHDDSAEYAQNIESIINRLKDEE